YEQHRAVARASTPLCLDATRSTQSVNPFSESVDSQSVEDAPPMTTASRPRIDPKTEDAGARLTFDRSRPGRKGVLLPALDVPETGLLPERFLRRELNLPEMSQNEVIRYFVGLSRLNYSIDTGFYPLGSCTMKYNPKVNEDVARFPGFAHVHPHQTAESAQGALAVLFELQNSL